MKRYITAGLLTAAILFPLFAYTYKQGMNDGVARYKRSKNFELTLQSMYFFGRGDAVVDCCNHDIICGK